MIYKELNQKINRLSNGLKKLGISKGDRVLVQLVNGPEIIISHYAIIKLGAVAVPLNVMYVAREASYIGGDTGAKAIILDKGFLPILQEIRPSLPALEHIIVLGDPVSKGAHRFEDLISDHSHRIEPYDAGFDDIVNIIYTSGTTGRPKGATQTHRSVLSNAASFWNLNKFTGDDRLLCALPLFNNFGIVVMMCTLYCGGTMILVDRFEGEKVLGHITRHKATYFAGTPTMYIYLLQAYDPVRHNVESLRVVNSGGAHCPAKVIEDVEEVLYTHPAVAMAAVIGIPDEVKGELAKAYIVLKEGTGATEKEIIDYVRGKMAKYKAPRMVQFVNTLPQGPTGKIMKRELRERVLGRRGA